MHLQDKALMGSFHSFLKSEIAALAEKHPEMSGKDRLALARKTCQAQNTTTNLIQPIQPMDQQLIRRISCALKLHTVGISCAFKIVTLKKTKSFQHSELLLRCRWRTHPNRVKVMEGMSKGQLSRRRLKLTVSEPMPENGE